MAYYNNYPFLAHKLGRIIRKNKKIYKKKLKGVIDSKLLDNPDPITSYSVVLATQPEAARSLDYLIMAEETWFMDYSRRFVFPETLELMKAIETAKVDVTKAGAYLPYDSCCISFPAGYKIDGLEVGGVLVTVMEKEQRQVMLDHFAKRTSSECYQVENGDEHEVDYSLGMIAVTYTLAKSAGGDGHISRLTWTIADLQELLTAKDVDIPNLVHGYNAARFEGVHEIEPYEKIYQAKLMKVISMLLIYCEAMPDKVRDGLPDKKATGYTNMAAKGKIVSMPSAKADGGTKNPTLVSIHLRQLRHEKYYQGEHSHKPVGSRFVFVQPYLRGAGDVVAETVEL